MDSGGTETRDFEATGAQSQAQASTQNQAPVQAQTQVHVRTEGFTTLSDGGELPVVDIVFIHGLGGHPKGTWTSTKADEDATETSTTAPLPPIAGAKKPWMKRIFKGSKQPEDKPKPEFFWPQAQLAKDFTAARILTYGYDCSPFKLFEAADRRGIIDHGDDMLSALADRRGDAKDRPIIFVVHSLGGLVLKRALWKSRNATGSNLRKVFEHTIGILFYGTPHRGGNYANLGDALVHAVNVLGHSASTQIINNLKRESEVLELLREDFRRMLDDNNFIVHSFYETKGLSFHRAMSEKVVDKTSAIIEHSRETARSAAGNHMEMCKFTGAEDTRYEAVKVIVRDLLQLERVQRTEDKSITEACLKSLTFGRRQAWMTEVHDHTEGTAEWLQHHHTYLSWLNRELICATPELLCLRGKPGSGKSVLMKSLMSSMAKLGSATPTSCAAFFFARKGSSKERSSNGLYRSILYQLMEADPIVCTTMLSKYGHKMRSLELVDGASPQRLRWTTTELKSILEDVFKTKSTRPTTILIDSVDECDEKKDARDVVRFCSDILRHARTNGVTLNICISSRINLAPSEDGHVIVLDQLNSADIRAYVRTRIEDHGTSAKKLIASVEDITTKSAGIFLWARLAMDILLDDLDDGRNLKYSQLRLEELPPELEDIYERMLVCSTKESEQDRYERLRFFQWIIFANRPMRLQEWYTIAGMIQVPPPSSFEQWSRSARNPVDAVEEGHDLMNRKHEDIQSDRGYGQDQLLKWIQRVSRGLVEVSYSSEKELSDNASALAGQGSVLSNIGESRTINVIHTSVRDFFRQSLTFGGLVPAHERLTTSEIHMYPSNQVLSKKEKYRQHKSLIPAPSILAEQDKMPEIEDADSIRYSTVRGYRSSLGAPVRRYRLSRIPKILAERDKMPEIEDAESIRYIPVREYTSSLGAPVRTNRSPHIPSILAERSKMSGIEDEDLRKKALVADGNATVLQSCLGYLKLKELNDLVERRQDHLKGLNDSSKQRQGHPSLPSEREEIRNHQRSMPSGTADHGIYRKEEIPFSYSAASSQVSSESKSMAGRLPLFSMSQGSEKSMDLQGGTTEDHIWNLHRMEDWLEERVRSCYNQSDAVDCSLQQLRFDAEAAHSRSRVDASVKAVVGDIYGLHQYSTDEIFTHASNAELQSLHIDWLTATLLQAWKRIVVLRDDVNDDASFLQFCMQAGTLDRLLIPVLESWGSDSHAVDVFIWAMAKGKKDIAREIVVRQFPPVFISNRSKAAVEDLHGPQRGWNKVETKDLSHRVKFSILEHEGFLIRLLGPVEHKTQWTTTPILRADAFSCWKEHFDALQQQSEEKMSVSAIREVLESGEPESPLRIAFRVRQSSPGIFPVMIAMGEYSAEDIDIHLPGQDTIQAVTSIGEYSDDELDDEPDDELARQATLRESIDHHDKEQRQQFHQITAALPHPTLSTS